MFDTLPVQRTELRHPHSQTGVRDFFGANRYEDTEGVDGREQVEDWGDVVTLEGGSGAWLARSKVEPYIGILIEFWDSDRMHHDAELLAERTLHHHVHVDVEVRRSDYPVDVTPEYFFEEVPDFDILDRANNG